MHTARLIEVYNCLCDETRLRIVHLLAQGPLCVCHLQNLLALEQVVVSKHLSHLRKRGMVEARRHEQWMIYSLPAALSPELDWQLRCWQDCLPTNAVFRDDLQKLKSLQPECCWVAEAVSGGQSTTKATRKKTP